MCSTSMISTLTSEYRKLPPGCHHTMLNKTNPWRFKISVPALQTFYQFGLKPLINAQLTQEQFEHLQYGLGLGHWSICMAVVILLGVNFLSTLSPLSPNVWNVRVKQSYHTIWPRTLSLLCAAIIFSHKEVVPELQSSRVLPEPLVESCTI